MKNCGEKGPQAFANLQEQIVQMSAVAKLVLTKSAADLGRSQ
jgi:hypothetical protein